MLRGFAPGSRLQVETLDGDGVRVALPVEVPEDLPATEPLRVYLPAGPAGAPLVVRARGAGAGADKVLWRERLLLETAASERIWVVAIGDTLGIDRIGSNPLLGTASTLDVSRLTAAAQLPDHWIGYDGVDWLVLNGGSLPLLSAASPRQRAALRDWFFGGGRLLVSLGSRGPELLREVPWLVEVFGAVGPGEVVAADPTALETFVSATERVERYPATRLELNDTREVIIGISSTREPLPLLFERRAGLGEAIIFSGGLSEAPLATWPQREELITRLVPSLTPERRGRGAAGPRTDLRYADVAGQLQSTMDRAPERGQVPFSAIVAILFCLIAFIGPLDYWLINRWLGRPLLGWLSFPLAIAALSAAMLIWRGAASEPRARQLTVIDIDPQRGLGRGLSLIQLFSGEAARFDVRLRIAGVLGTVQRSAILGSWGFAGETFGGIEVAGEDVRLPAYRLPAASDAGEATWIPRSAAGLPLAPRSSKALAGRWQFDTELDANMPLRRRAGSDLLVGRVVNPLPVDLLDGYLVYRNLVYSLPTRVPPGAVALELDGVQPKNFRWRLNRRRVGENVTRGELWDPAATDDLARLVEVLLFYEAAGGDKYSGLRNRVLGGLDLTRLLDRERAILVGRLGTPETRLEYVRSEAGGTAGETAPASAATYVRIVIPLGGDTAATASSSEQGRRR
jgi:hypothetical protein